METAVHSDKEEVIREAKAMLERGTSLYMTLDFVQSHLLGDKQIGAKPTRNLLEKRGQLMDKSKYSLLDEAEAVKLFADYVERL